MGQNLQMKKTLSVKRGVIRGCLRSMAFLVVGGIGAVASAQTTRTIRVVEYNIQADTTFTIPTCGLIVPFTGTGGSFTTSCSGNVTNGGVLEGIGEEIIAGDPAQPIDVLALNETTSNTTTVQPIVNGLNAFYAYYGSPAVYAMSPYQATESNGNPTSGNGPNAMVYNTNTLQLLASVPVDPPGGISQLGSASGMYREVMRYEFAPAGVTAGTNNEFYIYVSHYKASTGSSNDKARLGEATIIRSNAYVNLPANARVLYVGDFNVDDNSVEAGYQTICSNGVPNVSPRSPQGQGVDPLNILWGPYTDASTTINWSSTTTNTNILFMLSEESYERRYRDDFQIMTSNVYYDVAGGLQYVPGSYHVFANNGSFTWGTSVNSGGNPALNDLDPSLTNLYKLSAAVLLEDLTGASDHLPTVADYTIPIGTTAPPSASFTASPTNGVAPLNVSFTDTSSNSPTSWSWTFGDTGTSTSQNPSHTYTTPGVYNVTEIVSGAGGSSTDTVANLIGVYDPFAWWQLTYFGSTNNNPNTAPGGDYTGTGMSNTNKFLAGFNPTNPAAYLHIISIANTNTTDINVIYLGANGDNTWSPGIASRTNVLELTAGTAGGGYSSNFVSANVTNILSGGTGTGIVTNMLDAGGATNAPSRYYRVRVLVP